MAGNTRNQILLGAGCAISVIGCSILLGQINKNRMPIYVNDRFFCSELVSKAYRDAGFPITKSDPTNMSPCGVYDSVVLKPVGYLINTPPPPPANDYPSWKRAKIG